MSTGTRWCAAGSAPIVVEPGPNAGSRFLLDQPVTSVGRHPRSDIFLDDVTVSRQHVELRWEKDDFHVTSPGHSAANVVSSATAATKSPRRSRLYPSTDSGTIAEMDALSEPSLNDPCEEAIDDALSSLPADLRAAMSNVEFVVEDEPPDGSRCSACTAAYRCREGAARTAECFPTRSASSAGRSRDSLPATRIVYAARSGTSCSTRSRITSGSATSG
jgi:hypothetical protein